jgi:hypothetical protein
LRFFLLLLTSPRLTTVPRRSIMANSPPSVFEEALGPPPQWGLNLCPCAPVVFCPFSLLCRPIPP